MSVETTKDRVNIKKVEVLSNDWYLLQKTTFEFKRNNGTWQTMSRETYDRGNGATILLYSRERKTVILTRQFRYPVFVNGHDGMLIESCAGLLDKDDPETCIRKETEEETGFKIKDVHKVFEAFMSPGSVTEKLFFFVGEYFDEDKINEGGGKFAEGEDIDVLELSLDDALSKISTGEIVDAKTIMLLQYAKINNLLD